MVALRFFELESGPRARGSERRGHGGERIAVVESGGGIVVLIVLAFAGPRFRAGNNFLPEILGGVCVCLGRNLLSAVGFVCWCSILLPDFEGGANLRGLFACVFGDMVLDSLFCHMMKT